MLERRRSKRIPADLIVMFEIISDNVEKNVKDTPVIKDISMIGIKMLTNLRLPEGTELRLVISLLNITDYIEIVGKVAWSTTIQDDQNISGIKFISYEGNSKKLLAEMIKAMDEME